MKNNYYYIFLFLEERNGEYEYLHRSVHKLSDNKKTTAEHVADNYAKQFYLSKAEKDDGGYYFHGGEVFIKVESWKFINEEQYNVLKQFV